MSQSDKLIQDKLQAIAAALESGTSSEIKRVLHGMPAPDIAHLIESSPPRDREVLWQLINREDEADVLHHLNDEIRAEHVRSLNDEEVVDILTDLDTDDVADLLQELPRNVTHRVLQAMDEPDRTSLEAVLQYPEDSAGGLMNTDTVTVRPDVSLSVVMRYLRLHDKLPELTDALMVVSRSGKFVGSLPLAKIVVLDPSVTVREAMDTDKHVISAEMPQADVAKLFERNDLVSAPVINEHGFLIGRITIDDVIDVMREVADHSLMGMAGLDELEDTFGPVMKTSKRRAVWLGINLLTAVLASTVIGMFEATIEKVVALAVLMPIVASMGGIAGSQTLTLVIRGMALGHVGSTNASWLMRKELAVGALNGLAWASVVGFIASMWFDEVQIGLIIACAMMINLVIAALSGALLPLILKRMGIDPALAGGVLLTTITDVVGFLSFLGLATLYYA